VTTNEILGKNDKKMKIFEKSNRVDKKHKLFNGRDDRHDPRSYRHVFRLYYGPHALSLVQIEPYASHNPLHTKNARKRTK
jgi:hypothetical protein